MTQPRGEGSARKITIHSRTLISLRCHATSHSWLAASRHMSTAVTRSLRMARMPSSALALLLTNCSEESNKIAPGCVDPGSRIAVEESNGPIQSAMIRHFQCPKHTGHLLYELQTIRTNDPQPIDLRDKVDRTCVKVLNRFAKWSDHNYYVLKCYCYGIVSTPFHLSDAYVMKSSFCDRCRAPVLGAFVRIALC